MPFEPRCPPATGLVVPVRVDPDGRQGPTKARASGARWRRVAPSRYVPAGVDASLPEQRALEAACLLPPGGAVTGWAALRLAGATYFDGRTRGGGTRPVPLAVGRGRGMRAHDGVTWGYEPFGPEDLVTLQGVRCLHPRRALVDEVRSFADARERVVAVDMALAARVTSLGRVSAYLSEQQLRRSGTVREAVALASECSQSPPETRLRLVWALDAGLPKPWVNRSLEDVGGRFLCVPDLFDEEAGMVVEYDGEAHRSMARHDNDVRRQDRCRRAGLEYATVTGPDMHRLPALVERLRTTRRRARFAPAGERGWRLAAGPTMSLDDELDEREWRSEELWRSRGLRVLPWSACQTPGRIPPRRTVRASEGLGELSELSELRAGQPVGQVALPGGSSGWIGPSVSFREPPRSPARSTPRSTATASARIDSAISGGGSAPMAIPAGPWTCSRSASVTPLASSHSRRRACVRRDPIAPRYVVPRAMVARAALRAGPSTSVWWLVTTTASASGRAASVSGSSVAARHSQPSSRPWAGGPRPRDRPRRREGCGRPTC